LRHYATNWKVTGSRSDEKIKFVLIYLILPAALVPGVYAFSNRNEYQKLKKKCFWVAERSKHIRLTTSPPYVS
jgi:hypothetical protein